MLREKIFLISLAFVLSAPLFAENPNVAGEYFELLYLESGDSAYLALAARVYTDPARITAITTKRSFNLADKIRCETSIHTSALEEIESLAIAGQSECMFALGKRFASEATFDEIRANYWLTRTSLMAPSSHLKARALYELALLKSQKLGVNDSRVVVLMERAARMQNLDAQQWLQEQPSGMPVLAHVSFLKSLGRDSYANFRSQSAPSPAANITYEYAADIKEPYPAVIPETVDIPRGLSIVAERFGGTKLHMQFLLDSVKGLDRDEVLKTLIANPLEGSDDEILAVIKDLKSADLLQVHFERLFSDELRKLNYWMHLEDLYSLLGSSSSRATSLAKNPFQLFPRLQELRDAGISLDSIVQLERFRIAVKNYERDRFFFWSFSLKSTLAVDHVAALKAMMRAKIERLADLIREFRSNQRDKEYVHDARVNKQLAQLAIQNAIALRGQQLEQHARDFLATQLALDNQIREEAKLDVPMLQYVPQPAITYSVSPHDATTKLFYSHRSQTLEANDILTAKVSGEWSPICALAKSGKVNEPVGILTSSEGFRVHLTNGNSESSGHDERETQSKFSSSSSSSSYGFDWLKGALMAVGAVVGTIVAPGVGTALGLGLGATVGGPFSATNSKQNSEGTSTSSDKSDYKSRSSTQSQTAVFQSGLRLDDTPYPSMPAGAYLAVVVSKESRDLGIILDTFVVQPYFTYVAKQKSEVFFVVNDCYDSRSSKSLTVETQIQRPAGAELNRVLAQMSGLLREFSAKGDALVREGGELGSRIETLKAEVIAKLQRDTVLNVMADPTMRSVFMHWLQQESDRVVRKARLVDLTRSMLATQGEIAGLNRSLSVENEHDATLTARSRSYVPLQEHAVETVHFAAQYFAPILQLYFNGSPQTVHVSDEASEVKEVAEAMLNALDADSIASKTANYVVVRIPRPGSTLLTTKSQVPTVGAERSKQLWDHLFKPNLTNGRGIEIRFEDLYQDAGQGRLLPTKETPVILDMALLLGHDSSAESDYLYSKFRAATLDMEVEPEQMFATRSGSRTYLLSDEALRHHEISLNYVSSEDFVADAMNRIHSDISMNLATGKGLSPFSSFSFGRRSGAVLVELKAALDVGADGYPKHLSDVFMVMKVVSRNCEPMEWIRYE